MKNPNERLQVSVHTLQMAADCPERLALRLAGYDSVDDKALSLRAGVAVHEALAAWMKGGDWQAALLPYKEWCDENDILPTERRSYENILQVLGEVIARHPRSALPFEVTAPDYVEIDFVAPLGEASDGTPIDLIGVIDALARDRRTGQFVVIDHKTTGRLDESYIGTFNYDTQLTAYLLGVQEVTGETVLEGWINAIQLAKVPDSDRKCATHGTPYRECGPLHVKQTFVRVQRSREQLEEFRKLALRRAEKYVLPVARKVQKKPERAILTAPRDGMFGRTCDFCEFKTWCITGNRQQALMSTLLRPQEVIDEKRLRTSLFLPESENESEKGEQKRPAE